MSPEIRSYIAHPSRKEILLRPFAAIIVAGAINIAQNDSQRIEDPQKPEHTFILGKDGMNEFEIDIFQSLSPHLEPVFGPPVPDPISNDEITYAFAYEEARQEKERIRLEEEARIAEEARVAEEKRLQELKKLAPITPGVRSASTNWPSSFEPCGGEYPPCFVVDDESDGDYNAVNPDGCGGRTCGGKWQFDPWTWDNYGGYAFAQDAPPELQDAKAKEIWAGGAGCSHWNACGD